MTKSNLTSLLQELSRSRLEDYVSVVSEELYTHLPEGFSWMPDTSAYVDSEARVSVRLSDLGYQITWQHNEDSRCLDLPLTARVLVVVDIVSALVQRYTP